MPALPLTFRPHRMPLREAAAWLLPGASADEWLTELTKWPVSQTGLALFVLPRSRADFSASDLLVVPATGQRPIEPGRALPYGRAAQRLYLPVEARWEPKITEVELEELLPGDETMYLWHPAVGLVGFEPQDKLTFADLISLPAPRDTRWDRAEPGVAVNSRLMSLEPEQPPTLESLLEQGRGDIGERSGRHSTLPPAPHEHEARAAASLRRHFDAAVAKAALWLTSLAPTGAREPTWINHLQDWARRQLSNATAISERLRNKEIERLMHLLKTNPDEGLRYALPLAADAHRGLAAPTNFLGMRDVQFNLAALGGGGPADFWDISAEYRRKMVERYRELAEREMRLGRHRRAAYIFAQLLGDFASAASTLAAGGHYREAAVIYRDRLKRSHDAATCLEQGGFWSEAIALYEELNEHEKVGDLHARLEQPEQAAAAYRRAVEMHRYSNDHLSAARLLEVKLANPDEALLQLSVAWPHSGQAAACLAESFQLLARLGRHDAAQKRIAELRHNRHRGDQDALLVETLAGTATTYPSQPIKALAADVVRVVAAEQLATAYPITARKLLAAVNRLVPEDRLLTRDCQRYLREQEGRRPSGPKNVPTRGSIRVVHSFALTEGIEWRTAAASGSVFYAAGYLQDRLALVRANWKGEIHQPDAAPWKIAPAFRTSPILLAPKRSGDARLLVHVIGGPPLKWDRRFPATDRFPETVVAGPPQGIGAGTVAATYSPSGVRWTLDYEHAAYLAGSLTLSGWNALELIASRMVDEVYEQTFEPEERPLPLALHARHDAVFVGLEAMLIRFGLDESRERLELPGYILGLTGSAPHTRERLACTFADGGVVIWGKADVWHMERFSQDLGHPKVCFAASGELIVAATGACEVYETKDRHLKLVAQLAHKGPAPIAVLPTNSLRQFALICADGQVALYGY